MHKAMSGLAERTLGAAVKRATPCYVLSGERRAAARDNYSAAHFKHADKNGGEET